MKVGNFNEFIFDNQIVSIYRNNELQFRGYIYNKHHILRNDYLLFEGKEVEMIASSEEDELVIHIK